MQEPYQVADEKCERKETQKCFPVTRQQEKTECIDVPTQVITKLLLVTNINVRNAVKTTEVSHCRNTYSIRKSTSVAMPSKKLQWLKSTCRNN